MINRHYIIAFISLIFGILIGYWIHSSICKKEAEVIFTYDGEKTIKGLSYEIDSIYAEGVDPYGVYNKPEGIVPTPEDAAHVAEAVLSSIDGENSIKVRRPYRVKLLNDTIWSVKNSQKYKTGGATFTIYIDKRDGRIKAIF